MSALWQEYQEYCMGMGLSPETPDFAFSRKSRQKIFNRDKGKCVQCGQNGDHAAHIDHSRDNPDYDNPNNGRMLCIEDHLLDHINRHGRNGLSGPGNEWAIAKLIELLGYNPYE